MLSFLFLVFLVVLLWMLIEPRFYRVTPVGIQCQKLASPLQILHLSDIHFAYPDKYLARFFDQLAKLNPDLIVITGDVIDCREGVAVAAEQLAKLQSKNGIFAVMGNHDYYDYRLLDSILLHSLQGLRHPMNRNGTLNLRLVYEKLKIRELRNQSLHLDINGQRIGVHGVDDPVTGHADLTQIRPEKGGEVVNLLLSHTLDVLFPGVGAI